MDILNKIKSLFTTKKSDSSACINKSIQSKNQNCLIEKRFILEHEKDFNIKLGIEKLIDGYYVKWDKIYDMYNSQKDKKLNIVVPLLLIFGDNEYGKANCFLRDRFFLILMSDCEIAKVSFKTAFDDFHDLIIEDDTIFTLNKEFNEKITKKNSMRIHILQLNHDCCNYKIGAYGEIFPNEKQPCRDLFIQVSNDPNDFLQPVIIPRFDFKVYINPFIVPSKDYTNKIIKDMATSKSLFPPNLCKNEPYIDEVIKKQ